MKQYILLFFLSALIASSCNKETGPTTVNGKVEDKTTGSGIDNADVGLFESDGESAFGLGGVLIDEVYSDASGKFTFNFEARNGYSYYVQAIKDQYFNDQSNNITFVHNTGGVTDVTVLLQPEGYLSIHYKNEPPSSPYDQFGINGYVADSFTGGDIDTIIIYKVYGNFNNILHWGLSTYTESIDDTIYCPAFDTTFYEILY